MNATPDRHPLDSLFSPGGIAILGASPDDIRAGGQALHFLKDFGYAGRLYPVNPKYEDIAGLRCYPSVTAIDG